jgi:hypothetical protein
MASAPLCRKARRVIPISLLKISLLRFFFRERDVPRYVSIFFETPANPTASLRHAKARRRIVGDESLRQLQRNEVRGPRTRRQPMLHFQALAFGLDATPSVPVKRHRAVRFLACATHSGNLCGRDCQPPSTVIECSLQLGLISVFDLLNFFEASHDLNYALIAIPYTLFDASSMASARVGCAWIVHIKSSTVASSSMAATASATSSVACGPMMWTPRISP